jgi:D-alanine-D-alanine ligase
MVESIGVHAPQALTIAFGKEIPSDSHEMLKSALDDSGIELPVIAKPTCEGSSKGVRSKSLVTEASEFPSIILDMWNMYRQPILVEEFIDGDELTVGVLGNSPATVLGIMRVLPKKPTDRFIYSLEVKRDWRNQVDYESPAKIGDDATRAVGEAALDAYEILGCRDVARLDFRLRDGVPYFIEANPLPGLNPDTGDLVLLAKGMGIGHFELIGRILHAAMDRQP